MVKNPPAMQETQVQYLGQKAPLEEEMAPHSSTLAWRIPWTEEPDGLQSMGLQRVRHDWVTHFPFHPVGQQRRQISLSWEYNCFKSPKQCLQFTFWCHSWWAWFLFFFLNLDLWCWPWRLMVRFSQGWAFSPGSALGTLVGLVGTEGDGSRPVEKRLRWVVVQADPALVQFLGSWISPRVSCLMVFVP